MLEITNNLSNSPFGIVVMALMGLALLLFSLWFSFFALTMPLGSLISATKSSIGRTHDEKGERISDSESAIESEPHWVTGKEEGIEKPPEAGSHQFGKKRELELRV